MQIEHGHLLVVGMSPADPLLGQLEELGYYVRSAIDGGQTRCVDASRSIDLVRLDVRSSSAIETGVVEQIKTHEALRQTPVMVLASAGDTSTVEQFLALGVRDYISEPFTP